MKELNWKHIRNTVAITALVWPVFTLPWVFAFVIFSWLDSQMLFVVYFLLGVTTSVFVMGSFSPNLENKGLHGLLSIGITVPIAWVLVLVTTSYFFPSVPSDWQLIRRFERNEAVFNELRDVVQRKGGLETITLERTEPISFENLGISPEQLESYRTELKRLGLNSTSKDLISGNIYFSLDKWGPNILKYYVYRQTPPPPEQIVEKIIDDEVTGSTGVYRLIRDDWYIYAKAISD